MNRHEIQINPSLCIGCGQCAKDCPTSNIQLKDKKAEILVAEFGRTPAVTTSISHASSEPSVSFRKRKSLPK